MSSWAVRPGPVRTPSNYFTISSFHSSFLFMMITMIIDADYDQTPFISFIMSPFHSSFLFMMIMMDMLIIIYDHDHDQTLSNYFRISSFHSSFLFILKFAIFMLVIVTMVFQTTLYSLQCRQTIINAKLQRWRKDDDDDDDWACQADWWVVEPPWNRLQCASPTAFLGGDMHTLGFRPGGRH